MMAWILTILYLDGRLEAAAARLDDREIGRLAIQGIRQLIDRETEYTAYEILREFRGGFVAGFWQSVSRIFGQNLKSEYDREGDDKVLEQIVLYYEAGLL